MGDASTWNWHPLPYYFNPTKICVNFIYGVPPPLQPRLHTRNLCLKKMFIFMGVCHWYDGPRAEFMQIYAHFLLKCINSVLGLNFYVFVAANRLNINQSNVISWKYGWRFTLKALMRVCVFVLVVSICATCNTVYYTNFNAVRDVTFSARQSCWPIYQVYLWLRSEWWHQPMHAWIGSGAGSSAPRRIEKPLYTSACVEMFLINCT